MRRLLPFCASLCLAISASAAAEPSARLVQDFSTNFDPRHFELQGGDAPARYCRVDQGGMRCTIPAGEQSVSFCGLKLRSIVRGDFEITASYTILSLPPVEKGHGAGVKISVKDAAQEAASVQRINTKGKSVYSAYRGAVKADGRSQHTSEVKPTSAASGKLRLKRSGKSLQYSVQEDGDSDFTEIRTADFGGRDLSQVSLAAQTGGSGTEVDVLWNALEITASELVAPHAQKKRSTWFWPVFLFIILAIVAASIAVMMAKRSRQPVQ